MRKSSGNIDCTGKLAALVSLKLFINGNEQCYTIEAHITHERTSFLKCKQHILHFISYHKKERQTIYHSFQFDNNGKSVFENTTDIFDTDITIECIYNSDL